MSNYDIDKVSPRPWKIIDETGATFDAKGEIIFDPSNVPGNPETYLEYGGGYHGDEERARADTLHRIFCVNNHERIRQTLAAAKPE